MRQGQPHTWFLSLLKLSNWGKGGSMGKIKTGLVKEIREEKEEKEIQIKKRDEFLLRDPVKKEQRNKPFGALGHLISKIFSEVITIIVLIIFFIGLYAIFRPDTRSILINSIQGFLQEIINYLNLSLLSAYTT